MMYKTKIYDLAYDILINAIKEKTSAIIKYIDNGLIIYFYEDKIGIPAYLSLYMSNYSDIKGKMGLSVLSKNNNQSLGSIFIDFNKINSIDISYYNGKYVLKIGDIEFNFLKEN